MFLISKEYFLFNAEVQPMYISSQFVRLIMKTILTEVQIKFHLQ